MKKLWSLFKTIFAVMRGKASPPAPQSVVSIVTDTAFWFTLLATSSLTLVDFSYHYACWYAPEINICSFSQKTESTLFGDIKGPQCSLGPIPFPKFLYSNEGANADDSSVEIQSEPSEPTPVIVVIATSIPQTNAPTVVLTPEPTPVCTPTPAPIMCLADPTQANPECTPTPPPASPCTQPPTAETTPSYP